MKIFNVLCCFFVSLMVFVLAHFPVMAAIAYYCARPRHHRRRKKSIMCRTYITHFYCITRFSTFPIMSSLTCYFKIIDMKIFIMLYCFFVSLMVFVLAHFPVRTAIADYCARPRHHRRRKKPSCAEPISPTFTALPAFLHSPSCLP